ncbi:YbaB/EbfC family nucleoid-associated protein [Maridesulfovibrio ferrireducens]|uniref:YbaB/EbfC family nucleoid-associated protein n=1 Tax=Maridesulfovibrio ferrireducens TaxID=246191 RepID=UPI001A21E670|nr:YbaB/EbfC family nucleoid-associated protein [Maridesulfovibrio ferrireducens]MBI9110495.1 YbaB/EbfC family nucleoid-associated protein [Maridesulfovibrio ferrireducens]
MKGMNDLVRQAQVMQRKMTQLQEELKEREVESSAGGGMVTVKVNGSSEVLSITIDPAVVESGDVEMIQDLVLSAVNDANKKAKAMMDSEMAKITGGMNIPGMM